MELNLLYRSAAVRLILQSVHRFLKDESGPTSVEYCFMIGFILLVCISSIGALGEATHNYYLKSLAKMP